MKFILSVLAGVMLVAGSVSAAAIEKEGKLTVASRSRGGPVNYLCTLKAGDVTYEVKVAHDVSAKSMAIELEYPLTFNKKDRSYRFFGPYTLSEVQTENIPNREFYTFGSTMPGSYNFLLSFTAGNANPVFQMSFGGTAYTCR